MSDDEIVVGTRKKRRRNHLCWIINLVSISCLFIYVTCQHQVLKYFLSWVEWKWMRLCVEKILFKQEFLKVFHGNNWRHASCMLMKFYWNSALTKHFCPSCQSILAQKAHQLIQCVAPISEALHSFFTNNFSSNSLHQF